MQVSVLVDTVMLVLGGYPPSGSNFEGKDRDEFAVIPRLQTGRLRSELHAALKGVVEAELARVTVSDALAALREKLTEQARAEIAKEAELKVQMQRAADALAGMSPEDQEAVKAALTRPTVAP